MAGAEKSIGFLAFKRDKDGDIREFAVIPDEDGLAKWKSEAIPHKTSDVAPDLDEQINIQSNVSTTIPGRAKDLLDRFRQSMTSAHSMIAFTSAIAPGMNMFFVEQRLLPHAKKSLQLIEDDGINLIYGFSRNHITEIKQLLDTFKIDRDGFEALPGATLLSLVATFDSYFSEVVRFFLSIHPERYTKSDRQISLKEIFARKTLEEVVNQVIDIEVSGLMRGSHLDQVDFVETHLGVKIKDHYERWPNFIEIFERRNLVAHGNLIVNEAYLANCSNVKYKGIEKINVGQQLTLKPDYLHKSTDILSEFGILLVFVLWRKHARESEQEAFAYVNRLGYDLICTKRYKLAQRLLDFALNKQKRACSEITVRMMLVNLANSYKKLNNDAKCLEVLSSIDWTASKDNFQICLASLRGEVDKVVALMPGLAASKTIDANDFREWPVLDWVRDDPRVNETFEHVYGEPMRNRVPEAVTTTKTSVNQDREGQIEGLSAVPDDATRH